MKKEYVISVDVSEEQEKLLEDIRWKHIDIDTIIKEELQEQSEELIASIVEEVCCG